jgi:hypothetical protein
MPCLFGTTTLLSGRSFCGCTRCGCMQTFETSLCPPPSLLAHASRGCVHVCACEHATQYLDTTCCHACMCAAAAEDVYVHAELHGASSTIVRNHDPSRPVPPLTLQQAGCACVCRSKAWDAKLVTSAWWVYHHQVGRALDQGPRGGGRLRVYGCVCGGGEWEWGREDFLIGAGGGVQGRAREGAVPVLHVYVVKAVNRRGCMCRANLVLFCADGSFEQQGMGAVLPRRAPYCVAGWTCHSCTAA